MRLIKEVLGWLAVLGLVAMWTALLAGWITP